MAIEYLCNTQTVSVQLNFGECCLYRYIELAYHFSTCSITVLWSYNFTSLTSWIVDLAIVATVRTWSEDTGK